MPRQVLYLVVLLSGAVSIVVGQGTPAAVIVGLKSDDAGVRRAAQDEAVKLGAPAIGPLCGLIAEGTPMAVSVGEKALAAIAAQATAPGNDAYRQAVGAALGEQAKSAASDGARVAAVRSLGLVGGADAVGALAMGLRDAVTFEVAREALMRAPGAEATKGLLGALGEASSEQKPALILALGARRDPRAVKLLVGLLKSAEAPTRTAAAVALGQIGDVAAGKALIAAATKLPDAERQVALASVLALADSARATGSKAASALYQCALDGGATLAQRRAGLRGLGAVGSVVAVNTLLAKMSDPGLGATATALLANVPDDKLAGPLLAALKRAQGDRRAALLEFGRQRKLAGLPAS